MNAKKAIRFVKEYGVVLASARGPVPRLTEAIAGEPIKGSWWSHPKSRAIFRVLRAVTNSKDILVCRLVGGKITFVHRRLWPALVRSAKRFPPDRIAQVHEGHTATGRHLSHDIPFPKWVPPDVLKRAKEMMEAEALAALGDWTSRDSAVAGEFAAAVDG